MQKSSIANKIFKRNNSLVHREVADQTILVPIKNKKEEMEHIYTLNEIGTEIFQLFDGEKSVRQIIDIIVAKYDVDNETAEKDVIELIKQLLEAEAIQEV